MTGLGRSIIAFLVGAFIAGVIIWWLQPEKERSIDWPEKSADEINRVIQSASANEVIDFMNWAESAKWDPANDVIPAHVANAGDIRKARAAVEQHHLQFAGKTDTALIKAVRDHPAEYIDYCTEMRAVSRFFIRE